MNIDEARYIARLNKNRSKALCGICRTMVAFIMTDESHERELYLDGAFQLRRNGVWALSELNAQRYHEGRAPRLRRVGERIRRWMSRLDIAPGEESPYLEFLRHPRELPATVKCPHCGTKQTLDPDVLDAGPSYFPDLSDPDQLADAAWTPDGTNPVFASLVRELEDPDARKKYRYYAEKGRLVAFAYPTRPRRRGRERYA